MRSTLEVRPFGRVGFPVSVAAFGGGPIGKAIDQLQCTRETGLRRREARLNQATVSAALAGKPIAAKSLGLIASALLRIPAIEIIDSLTNSGTTHLGMA